MTSFHEKQRKLFNHLKDAEAQCGFSKSNNTSQPTYTDYNVIDKRTYKKAKHEMKQFRGRESIYKRPEANLLECLRSKSTPGYIRNPRKWKYYSLADVTPEQMSDKTNTQTALAFIRELEEKELNKCQENQIIDETGAVFKKPTFKISKTIKEVPDEEQQQPMFKSNKIIMPEYVVGVSGKKINTSKRNINVADKSNLEQKNAELKLNHLYDEMDDDDEPTD